MRRMSGKHDAGFTMIEIISVLIIIGVLATVVVQHIMDVNTDLVTKTELIKNHLRYAQSRAMNSDAFWYITFEPDGSGGFRYSMNKTGAAVNPKYLPGEGSGYVSLPSGMTLQYEGVDISTPVHVNFMSKWGKPYTDAEGTSYQTGNRTITVVDAGGSRDIIITENTGFIP